ncbi:histidine phosphatase family protein [Acinetobacter sp. VNH17]|uniref:Histidine phosphatase family protein n=1 Tax=Acinetobacter thutiue TaxID=2998078 RepID=A0ABT7WKH0_9GAMM|nr:histidine phosphatase family protein [Acinetobacter thutiue]MCY6411074.1 histidine phosphatase family protein [Acinetobacter thutiue]MDN0013176.1 histidine phosphatase family protein [Acinetobacter thutiue]
MAKLRLDLLRHGETILGHTLRGRLDDELTEQGWSQMQATIQENLNHPEKNWDVIVSSPLQRCRLFAEKLANDLQRPLLINEQIQEMHFGDWEGVSTQTIYATSPELLANFWQFPTQYHTPNGESLAEFHQRVFNGFQQIAEYMQQHQYQSALVVTHGGVIKLLSCLAQQQSMDDLLKMSAELGQLHSFRLSHQPAQLSFKRVE